MSVKPVPEGFHTVTPYISVQNLPHELAFLEKAFNAQIVRMTKGPDGLIRHSEVKIGDSMLMFAEACEEWPSVAVALYLYLPDVDASYQQALQAGAISIMAPKNQFYGDRNGGVKDPVGNTWWLSTHLEDLTDDQIAERMKAQFCSAN